MKFVYVLCNFESGELFDIRSKHKVDPGICPQYGTSDIIVGTYSRECAAINKYGINEITESIYIQ